MASNTQYEKLKKKALARAQQNRKNRVERSNKQYGNKMSKSQQAYIAGDVLSSASMKAYAYKKNPSHMPKQSFITGGRSKSNYNKVQNGENPYEAKYVWTGKPTAVKGGTRADGSTYDSFISKKRFLTDDEKKMWEAQGSLDKRKYDQNYKYHWFDNYNKDAKTFKEHSNLTQDGKMLWDGMKVAKNRVANGGSKWNYLGGFLKDTLVDGSIEAIRYLDRVSSAGTGAVAGLLEESANLIKGDVDWNRPLENIKESLQQSEETGWGKGLDEFFDDANKRNVEKDVAYYKEMQKGLSKNSDAYKHYESLIKNAENTLTDGKHKTFRSVTGFIGDVKNPIEVGDALVSGLKGATKLAAKSGKELLSGTADLSTAFKSKDELSKIAFEHQDMLNRMSAYKKYLQEEYVPHLKKTGKKFDDVEAERLFEDSSYAREYAERSGNLANNIDQRINHSLDKGYSNAMANDTKQIVNEVKSNPGTEKLGEFLDEMDSVAKDNEMYNKTFKGFYNTKNKGELDIDGLFEMLDNIDDDFSYGMLDWLEQNKPSVYRKYMGDIDNIDDMADIGITPKIDIPSDIIEKPKKENKTLRKYNEDIDNYIKQEIKTSGNSKNVLNDAYNKMNIDRMMQESTISVSENLPYSINKQKFLNGTKDFTDKLNTMKRTELEELSSVLRTLEDIPDVIKRDEVVKAMNDVLFGGEKVIRSSITPKDLRNLILHCDDLISYKLTELTGGFSFKPRGSNNTKNGTHYMKDRKGKDNVFRSNFNMYAPTSTDELFEEKMSLVDSLVGIKHKGELSKPIEELKKLRRSLLENGEDLSQEDLTKLDDLESRLKIRQEAYDNIKNLDYDEYQEYIQKHYGKEDVIKSELDKLASKHEKLTFDDFYNESVEEIQKSMESGKLDKFLQEGGNPEDLVKEITQTKYEDYLNERSSYKNRADHNQRNINIREDGTISQSPRLEQENLNDVGELEVLSQDEILSNNIKKIREQLGVSKPLINKRKIKLAKGQKLGSIPPVVENSKNLRKVIESELDMMYKNPKEYDKMKDAFKRIKKEYVQSMRSFGVRDEQYFEKVKQVQDDLKAYYEGVKETLNKVQKSIEVENNTPLDKISNKYKPMSDEEIFKRKVGGGQGAPKFGMNLQLLAQRISDAFDEMDNLIFGDEWQTLGDKKLQQIDSLQRRSHKATKNVDVSNQNAMDYDAFIDEDNSALSDFWNKVNNKGVEPMVKQTDEQMVEPMVEQIVDKFDNIINEVIAKANINKMKRKPKKITALDKTYQKIAGNIPNSSAKLLDNGNVLDKTSGELKPLTKEAKRQAKELSETYRWSSKNAKEDEMVQKFLSRGEKNSIHDYFNIFSTMNIKFDPYDEKSIEKAFKRFDNIVEKNFKNGRYSTENIEKFAKELNPKKTKDFPSKPVDSILDKMSDNIIKEGERLEEPFNRFNKWEKEYLEKVDEFKQLNGRMDSEEMYRQMFDKLDQDSKGGFETSLNYLEEMSDWLMNQGGLGVRENNQMLDMVKRKQLELAQKGIDLNLITPESFEKMKKKLSKQTYTSRVDKDFDIANKNIALNKRITALDKMAKDKPNQTILDKMSDNIIKEGERLEEPFNRFNKWEKEYLEKVDEFKQLNGRMETEEMYRHMFDKLNQKGNVESLNYLEEMSDWLMNQGGLEVRERNQVIDMIKRKQLELAQKGISATLEEIENAKNMSGTLKKQTYSSRVNEDFDVANARNKDMKKILEFEKNRQPSEEILNKIVDDTNFSMIEDAKNKRNTRQELRRRRREEEILKKQQMDIDQKEMIDQFKANRKQVVNNSKINPKQIQNKLTMEDVNKNISDKSISESIEKELAYEQEQIPTTFDKFKEWFNDREMPYDENVLYDTYKRWLNSWKKGLTVYNPGWHVQNYFQNKGQNYLALGDKAFGSQKQARNVLKEIKGEVGNGDMILTKNGKTYSQKDIADLAKRHGVVEGQADNIIESRGMFTPLETKVDNSWIMKKLNESEETARLHHFITQIERGMSPEEASKSVNKYLYDYSKQNKADRLMSDFVDPFWTFHKNNARLMLSQAIENPQRIAKINRGIRGLQNDVDGEDKALEQHRSIQSPIGSFKDEVNEDTYNYQYDLNLFPSYEGSIPLEKDDVENKLNPLVKIAKQQMEGVGNFGNKITDKEVSGYNEVTKDERALEILREVNPFMNPLVKALYNSSKHQEKADEEKQSQKASNKQILATWLEYIFGSKGNYYRDVR